MTPSGHYDDVVSIKVNNAGIVDCVTPTPSYSMTLGNIKKTHTFDLIICGNLVNLLFMMIMIT